MFKILEKLTDPHLVNSWNQTCEIAYHRLMNAFKYQDTKLVMIEIWGGKTGLRNIDILVSGISQVIKKRIGQNKN